MFFYLVTNLKTYGAIDYKGLDLEQFVAGSQVYNEKDNEFAVASTEDFKVVHADVTQISESDYATYRESFLPKPIIPVTEDKLKELTDRQDAADFAIMTLMDSVMGVSLS